MTLDELMRQILTVLPEATIGEDNDGQVVIYTNYRIATSKDNPSLPEGEEHLVSMG